MVGLRFSNTGSYDAQAQQQLAASPVILSDWRQHIDIPPPPANTSAKVSAELAELHRMERERNPETEARILAERTLNGFEFGNTPYSALAEQSPEMKRLLDLVVGEANPIIFALKKQHDRVRPSTLDPSLSPCIEVPGNPSYPSGHATRAYAFAYLFSEVDPDNTGTYFQRASEIAIRREEAGVHFGSDTEAGKELGRQVHLALVDKPAYKKQLLAARLEFYDGQLPEEFQPPRDPYEILAERKAQKEKADPGNQEVAPAVKPATLEPAAEKPAGFLKNFLNRF